MSNFNMPASSASQSAISLGGEWRSRDQMEANKYKMSGLGALNKKRAGKGAQPKGDKTRPRSTPTSQQMDGEEGDAPKSAPPGSKPRCGRVNEVESPTPTARKSLEARLPLKKKSGTDRSHEMMRQYDLGPGMMLSKSKSKVAVTISTGDGGDATPPPILRRAYADGPVADPANSLQTTYKTSRNLNEKNIPGMSSNSSSTSCNISGSRSLPPTHSPHSNPRPPTRFSRRSPSPGTEMTYQDALISQLQQQVSDLTLYLEEERLNHKTSKEKAGNLLREKMREQERKHKEAFGQYKEQQEEQVSMLKELHARETDHLKSSSEKALARMKGELEFLQGAFEAYKGTLTQDMVEKWTKKESDMKLKFHEELERELSEQRSELNDERNRERNAISREYQKQLHKMSQEHKKETENLMKRFSGAAHDAESLRKAMDQLKAVRAELDDTRDSLQLSREESMGFKHRLSEAKMMLIDYQENFEGKIGEVDEKYNERIHLLMNENAELRKRYMQKCNELFNEKSNTEYRRVEKVMNTKEMMRMLVHVRNRSNVSLACSDPAADAEPRLPVTRPVSAPSTRLEAHKAHRMAGETNHLTPSAGATGLQRPHTTNLVGARPTAPQVLNAFGSAQSLQSL